jgi:hypothetical protein
MHTQLRQELSAAREAEQSSLSTAADAESRTSAVAEAHAEEAAGLRARLAGYEAQLAERAAHGRLVEGLAEEVSRLQADLEEAESRLEGSAHHAMEHKHSEEEVERMRALVAEYSRVADALRAQLSDADARCASAEEEAGRQRWAAASERGESGEGGASASRGEGEEGEGAAHHDAQLWRDLASMLLADACRLARHRAAAAAQAGSATTSPAASASGSPGGDAVDALLGSPALAAGAEERPDGRAALLRAAVARLRTVREQNRSMARLLWRLERGSEVVARVNRLLEQNRDLACRNTALKIAHVRVSDDAQRLSRQNCEMAELLEKLGCSGGRAAGSRGGASGRD